MLSDLYSSIQYFYFMISIFVLALLDLYISSMKRMDSYFLYLLLMMVCLYKNCLFCLTVRCNLILLLLLLTLVIRIRSLLSHSIFILLWSLYLLLFEVFFGLEVRLSCSYSLVICLLSHTELYHSLVSP